MGEGDDPKQKYGKRGVVGAYDRERGAGWWCIQDTTQVQEFLNNHNFNFLESRSGALCDARHATTALKSSLNFSWEKNTARYITPIRASVYRSSGRKLTHVTRFVPFPVRTTVLLLVLLLGELLFPPLLLAGDLRLPPAEN